MKTGLAVVLLEHLLLEGEGNIDPRTGRLIRDPLTGEKYQQGVRNPFPDQKQGYGMGKARNVNWSATGNQQTSQNLPQFGLFGELQSKDLKNHDEWARVIVNAMRPEIQRFIQELKVTVQAQNPDLYDSIRNAWGGVKKWWNKWFNRDNDQKWGTQPAREHFEIYKLVKECIEELREAQAPPARDINYNPYQNRQPTLKQVQKDYPDLVPGTGAFADLKGGQSPYPIGLPQGAKNIGATSPTAWDKAWTPNPYSTNDAFVTFQMKLEDVMYRTIKTMLGRFEEWVKARMPPQEEKQAENKPAPLSSFDQYGPEAMQQFMAGLNRRYQKALKPFLQKFKQTTNDARILRDEAIRKAKAGSSTTKYSDDDLERIRSNLDSMGDDDDVDREIQSIAKRPTPAAPPPAAPPAPAAPEAPVAKKKRGRIESIPGVEKPKRVRKKVEPKVEPTPPPSAPAPADNLNLDELGIDDLEKEAAKLRAAEDDAKKRGGSGPGF